MPFVKGQSGNPKGRGPNRKPFTAALMVAVGEADKNSNAKKLLALAKKLVEQGLTGDVQAITQIRDTLQGKPTQAIEHSGPEGAPIQIEDFEVAQKIARARVAALVVSEGGE